MILLIAALFAGLVIFSPGFALKTKVSELPFCAGNFAFSRSARTLGVGAGQLELVDERAVGDDDERDQRDGREEPDPDHAARMVGAPARERGQRSGRRGVAPVAGRSMVGHSASKGVDASGRVGFGAGRAPP